MRGATIVAGNLLILSTQADTPGWGGVFNVSGALTAATVYDPPQPYPGFPGDV